MFILLIKLLSLIHLPFKVILCALELSLYYMFSLFHVCTEISQNIWSWKISFKSWKIHGKVIKNSWKIDKKFMERSWKSHKKFMAKSWENPNFFWKSHGKILENSWKSHEKVRGEIHWSTCVWTLIEGGTTSASRLCRVPSDPRECQPHGHVR